MRIVGGLYRHRIISWPDDQKHIRPTKDRVREAIFSALGDISGFVAVDLYSGSGAMGIEAISRGARFCYFVDISPIALKTTENNIKSLDISKESYLIIAKKDTEALKTIENEVDLLILDPPYAEGKYEEIISLCGDILSKNAVIVCESNKHLIFDSCLYKKIKEYNYGETIVTILWK